MGLVILQYRFGFWSLKGSVLPLSKGSLLPPLGGLLPPPPKGPPLLSLIDTIHPPIPSLPPSLIWDDLPL